MNPTTKIILTVFALTSLAACNESPNTGPGTKSLGTFKQAQNCEEIRTYVKDFAQRAQKNPNGIVPVNIDGFSGGIPAASPTMAPNAPQAEDAGAGASVTQSDLAYPDPARGLLFTASWEKKLRIFKVNPAAETQLLVSLTLDFSPFEMVAIRSNNRDFLAVFGSQGGFYGIGPEPAIRYDDMVAPVEWEEPKFVMALFDVSNPSQPQELKRETSPGSFLEGRAIQGKDSILWVTQRWVPLYLNNLNDTHFFPEKTTGVPPSTSSAPVVTCENTYLYNNDTLSIDYSPSSLNETVVSILDLKSPNFETSSQGIFSPSWRTILAVNPDHLFLAQNIDNGRSDTELFQFDLFGNTSLLNLSASGLVPGDIPNQFFIDEQNGVLRVFHHKPVIFFDDFPSGPVAEGGSGSASPGVVSNLRAQENLAGGNYLSTYQKNDNQLKLVGRNGPFETEESPYAARFLGNIGCVITFRQIDPLTCFEIKNPAQPTRLGKLDIAGVSYHLEAVTEALLLGIGQGASNGSVVANLFDISDPQHPNLAAQKLLSAPGEFTTSPVFYDYRALAKDENNRQFAVPLGQGILFDIMPGDAPPSPASLALFSIDVENRSIISLGSILKNNGPDDYDSFQRAFFFNDTLATISWQEVGVYLRSNLGKIFNSPLGI